MVKFNSPAAPELKPLAHLLKLAKDHDKNGILVVAYWARRSACLFAKRLPPEKKCPETDKLIRELEQWLEETKKANKNNHGITKESIAKSMIDEYAMRMFTFGNMYDTCQIYDKLTMKTYYTAGMLWDVMEQFGSLSNQTKEKRKFAKSKSVYIYNFLKAGQIPLPGPPRVVNEESNGIVPKSNIPEAELPLGTSDMEKELASKLASPDNQHVDIFSLNFANHMLASSPITSQVVNQQLVVPDQPVVPAQPVIPDQPVVSAQPVVPEQPIIPKEPVLPKQPVVPKQSVLPKQPVVPKEPVLPKQPVVPKQPVLPKQPVFPKQPALPKRPIIPKQPITASLPATRSSEQKVLVTPEQLERAQMYCEFITSALKYDDVNCAIENIHNILNLLQIADEVVS